MNVELTTLDPATAPSAEDHPAAAAVVARKLHGMMVSAGLHPRPAEPAGPARGGDRELKDRNGAIVLAVGTKLLDIRRVGLITARRFLGDKDVAASATAPAIWSRCRDSSRGWDK